VSSGEELAGGIAGYVRGNSTITYCAALNPSISAEDELGRIAGYIGGDATLENNFAWEEMVDGEGNPFSDSTENGIGKTEAALAMQATYENPAPEGLGWDFTLIWVMDGARPIFQWQL